MNKIRIPGHWMTPEETADFIGVSKRTLRGLVHRRLIPVTKLNNKTLRFNRNEIEKALAKLTVGGIT